MVQTRSGGLRAMLACGVALAAGCSGGGGGGGAQVYFSFTAAGATVAEGAAPASVSVVLHTSLPSTSMPASVTVFDRATGTAVAGSDYAMFPPALLTFPMGSMDGDVQSLPFTALDDMTVEGASETVRLGLMGPMGSSMSGATTFTETITDIHTATIRFALAASQVPDESNVFRSVAVELDLPPGVALGVAAGASVTDAGGGSASSGADYASMSAQMVSFTAGSPDGASATIAVHVLDDALIEPDETVNLSLGAPSAGTSVGAQSSHQLTIQDDDTPGTSAFIATEGVTGTEHTLAYNALVDLGSQTVGAGPNAGTRVRVTNAGGSAMTLGAPEVIGSAVNDFSVTVEAAPMPPSMVAEETSGELAPDALSPLIPLANPSGPGIELSLDSNRLAELSALTRATMHGFPVPGFGDVTLALQRRPLPIAPGAVLRVDGVDVPGGLERSLGDLTIWTGSSLELPGSRVFLALSSAGSRGFLELPTGSDRFVHIVSEAGTPELCRVVRGAGLAALGFEAPPFFCEEPREVPGQMPRTVSGAGALALPGTQPLTAADCRIAIETDYQLFQKFGSANALTSYVTQLMAAVSAQYFRDIQTSLSIAYLGVYTTPADPWTSQDSGGNTSALLNEFIAAWAPNHWPVQANLAHFISGANLGGGIAYLDVLCNQSFGFGVSGNIDGSINWGNWNGAPGNFTWDFVVVAHELGHNFGSQHTHAYCPPLDQCAANCSGTTQCSQGTIMSYCHTCGGMDNIDLEFHPVTANIMRESVNSSCLGLSALSGGDYVQYLVRFNPLTATGQRDATLRFAHDASNEPQPFLIRLRGMGN